MRTILHEILEKKEADYCDKIGDCNHKLSKLIVSGVLAQIGFNHDYNDTEKHNQMILNNLKNVILYTNAMLNTAQYDFNIGEEDFEKFNKGNKPNPQKRERDDTQAFGSLERPKKRIKFTKKPEKVTLSQWRQYENDSFFTKRKKMHVGRCLSCFQIGNDNGPLTDCQKSGCLMTYHKDCGYNGKCPHHYCKTCFLQTGKLVKQTIRCNFCDEAYCNSHKEGKFEKKEDWDLCLRCYDYIEREE